jgi:chlorophyll synthase
MNRIEPRKGKSSLLLSFKKEGPAQRQREDSFFFEKKKQKTLKRTSTRAPRVGLAAVGELLKPITWFAPMWAYGCGVVSSGQHMAGHWWLVLAGVALCGPMVTGTSQAVNDWYDRHVDAINEPGRAIPSGRVPGHGGLYLAGLWTILSLALATTLGSWAFAATVLGLALAWAYSAPPARIKLNGWWGNAACGACYEGLPWFTGAAIMAGTLPSHGVIIMAALYSIGAHGIMTLNDFKSIEGDRQMGVRTLPVQLGATNAARLACVVMAAPQVAVVAWLLHQGYWIHGGIVAGLLLAQVWLMTKLLQNPREKAPWYNATGTSLYVLGMLATAFALRGLHG